MAAEFDERLARLEAGYEYSRGHTERLVGELEALRREVANLRTDLRALAATYEADRRFLRFASAVVLATATFIGWLIGVAIQLWRS